MNIEHYNPKFRNEAISLIPKKKNPSLMAQVPKDMLCLPVTYNCRIWLPRMRIRWVCIHTEMRSKVATRDWAIIKFSSEYRWNYFRQHSEFSYFQVWATEVTTKQKTLLTNILHRLQRQTEGWVLRPAAAKPWETSRSANVGQYT